MDTLNGFGGADVLIGGQGDDVLAVSDLSFKRIVGGNGNDTLRLDGSGLALNLTHSCAIIDCWGLRPLIWQVATIR